MREINLNLIRRRAYITITSKWGDIAMKKKSVLITFRLFTILLLITWLITCAINPVTGKRELMLLSEADEISLGQQSDQGIIQTYGLYPDQGLNNYVSNIGQSMARISHRPNLKYEFKVMDSPVINAFAVPGGYVYVTRGILAHLNNEAELAGVVGHEIGHITARHSAIQYTRAQLAQLGLGIGAALSQEIAQYAGLAAQGIGLLFLKFSRDNERQSDDLGMEYSSRVGYDAREMANLFKTLDRIQSQSGGSGLPDWLSTHPNPADRIGTIQRHAANYQKTQGLTNLKINRNEFLTKVDGMVYGEDPRQGYVQNNIFYHPELKFSFPVPGGWTLNNTPSQVQMAPSDGKAAVLFSMAAEKDPQSAASQFITSNQAQVQSQNSIRVNNLNAVKLISVLASESQTLQLVSYFIAKDARVYVFHGFTAQADFGNYQSALQVPMQGFANLTDAAKINVKPDLLRIKRVNSATTLRQALKTNGVADTYLYEHAIINGLELTSMLAANTMIKVVERGR
jgi:predicted Zn-dependent protease